MFLLPPHHLADAHPRLGRSILVLAVGLSISLAGASSGAQPAPNHPSTSPSGPKRSARLEELKNDVRGSNLYAQRDSLKSLYAILFRAKDSGQPDAIALTETAKSDPDLRTVLTTIYSEDVSLPGDERERQNDPVKAAAFERKLFAVMSIALLDEKAGRELASEMARSSNLLWRSQGQRLLEDFDPNVSIRLSFESYRPSRAIALLQQLLKVPDASVRVQAVLAAIESARGAPTYSEQVLSLLEEAYGSEQDYSVRFTIVQRILDLRAPKAAVKSFLRRVAESPTEKPQLKGLAAQAEEQL